MNELNCVSLFVIVCHCMSRCTIIWYCVSLYVTGISTGSVWAIVGGLLAAVIIIVLVVIIVVLYMRHWRTEQRKI